MANIREGKYLVGKTKKVEIPYGAHSILYGKYDFVEPETGTYNRNKIKDSQGDDIYADMQEDWGVGKNTRLRAEARYKRNNIIHGDPQFGTSMSHSARTRNLRSAFGLAAG